MIPIKLLQPFGRTPGLPKWGRRDTRPSTKRGRLRVEALEDRRLLSGPTGLTISPPFIVNTTTEGFQSTTRHFTADNTVQAAAYTSQGAVVVWYGNGPGDDMGIFARRFTDHTAASDEFQVNWITAGDQFNPVVAGSADTFAVAWNSSGGAVYGRLYTADGNSLAQFQVVAPTSNSYNVVAAVAMNPTGTFAVLYHQYISMGRFGNKNYWMVQRYNLDGQAQGKPINVATTNNPGDAEAGLAMDNQGNFVVAWDGDSAYRDPPIAAQRYSAAGRAIGSEIVVQATPVPATARLGQTNVAMDAQGNFLVTWGRTNGSPAIRDREGQLFLANGSPTGGLLTFANPSWTNRGLSMQADGQFVVTWRSSTEASGPGVYVQRFNANGTAIDEVPVLVAQPASTDQSVCPSVALNGNGNFMVVWNDVSTETDWDVFACYVDPPVHGHHGNQPGAVIADGLSSGSPSVQQVVDATNPIHLWAADKSNGDVSVTAGVAVPVMIPADQVDGLFTFFGEKDQDQWPF